METVREQSKANLKLSDADIEHINSILTEDQVVAVLFTDAGDDKVGTYRVKDTVTESNMDNFGENDKCLYIAIKEGYKSIIYKDKGLSGNQIELYPGVHDLEPLGWDKEISSFEIQLDSSNDQRITVYGDKNFENWSQEFEVGEFDKHQLVKNDDIDSIKIPTGLKVTLYKDDGFSGKEKTLFSECENLDDYGMGGNISSLKVERSVYEITSIIWDIDNIIIEEIIPEYAIEANYQNCSEEEDNPVEINKTIEYTHTDTVSFEWESGHMISNTVTLSAGGTFKAIELSAEYSLTIETSYSVLEGEENSEVISDSESLTYSLNALTSKKAVIHVNKTYCRVPFTAKYTDEDGIEHEETGTAAVKYGANSEVIWHDTEFDQSKCE